MVRMCHVVNPGIMCAMLGLHGKVRIPSLPCTILALRKFEVGAEQRCIPGWPKSKYSPAIFTGTL